MLHQHELLDTINTWLNIWGPKVDRWSPVCQQMWKKSLKCLEMGTRLKTKTIIQIVIRHKSKSHALWWNEAVLDKGYLHVCDCSINVENYIKISEHNILPCPGTSIYFSAGQCKIMPCIHYKGMTEEEQGKVLPSRIFWNKLMTWNAKMDEHDIWYGAHACIFHNHRGLDPISAVTGKKVGCT